MDVFGEFGLIKMIKLIEDNGYIQIEEIHPYLPGGLKKISQDDFIQRRNKVELKHDNLWFCEDCYYVSESGDESGMRFLLGEEEGEIMSKKIWSGVERLQKTYDGHIISNNDSETGNGIEEFSHHGCDCCGSNLSGKLYRMAIIG